MILCFIEKVFGTTETIFRRVSASMRRPTLIFLAETPSELVAALGQGGSVRTPMRWAEPRFITSKRGDGAGVGVGRAQVDAKDMEGNIPAHTADERAMEELVDGVGRGVPQHHVENDRGNPLCDPGLLPRGSVLGCRSGRAGRGKGGADEGGARPRVQHCGTH